MEELNELTFFNFNKLILNSEKDFFPCETFCVNLNLLPQRHNNLCNSSGCTKELKIKKKETYKLGYIFQCNKCNKYLNPTNNTWFCKTKITVLQSLQLIYLWICGLNIKQTMYQTNLSRVTKVDYYNF